MNNNNNKGDVLLSPALMAAAGGCFGANGGPGGVGAGFGKGLPPLMFPHFLGGYESLGAAMSPFSPPNRPGKYEMNTIFSIQV
jgi:hypothetical protein